MKKLGLEPSFLEKKIKKQSFGKDFLSNLGFEPFLNIHHDLFDFLF